MDENDGDDSVAAASAVESPDGYYGQNMYYYYSPHPHNMVPLLFDPSKNYILSDSN